MKLDSCYVNFYLRMLPKLCLGKERRYVRITFMLVCFYWFVFFLYLENLHNWVLKSLFIMDTVIMFIKVS